MVAYHAEWRNGAGREQFRDKQAASKARYPDRTFAREVLRKAVANGHVMRGPCEFASSECRGGIEAHHDDYTKPLDVRWVCRRHHRPLDNARRAAAERVA